VADLIGGTTKSMQGSAVAGVSVKLQSISGAPGSYSYSDLTTTTSDGSGKWTLVNVRRQVSANTLQNLQSIPLVSMAANALQADNWRGYRVVADGQVIGNIVRTDILDIHFIPQGINGADLPLGMSDAGYNQPLALSFVVQLPATPTATIAPPTATSVPATATRIIPSTAVANNPGGASTAPTVDPGLVLVVTPDPAQPDKYQIGPHTGGGPNSTAASLLLLVAGLVALLVLGGLSFGLSNLIRRRS